MTPRLKPIWDSPQPQRYQTEDDPDSKFYGTHMGHIWVLSAPDGPHEPRYVGKQRQKQGISDLFTRSYSKVTQ